MVLTINDLRNFKKVFNSLIRLVCNNRDITVLNKKRYETKKKNQRNLESFSQVINRGQSISFFALLGCQKVKKLN